MKNSKNKKANFKRRKGVYTWTDGGRQLAREQRVNKKKNMDSPVAAQGSLATVCREISRWEMSYGTEISLKKGSVVMPICPHKLVKDTRPQLLILLRRQPGLTFGDSLLNRVRTPNPKPPLFPRVIGMYAPRGYLQPILIH